MKGKENECAAVRLGKSRLMVAMAILAVAFVVLAATPAALTDGGTQEATTTASTTATKLYVGGVDANDSNDGASKEKSMATIAEALKGEKVTTIVLLGNAGDESNISITEDITIKSEGTTQYKINTTISSTAKLTLENVEIAVKMTGQGNAITFNASGADLDIQDCTVTLTGVENDRACGVHVQSAKSVTIDDTTFTNAGKTNYTRGMYITNVSGAITLTDNKAYELHVFAATDSGSQDATTLTVAGNESYDMSGDFVKDGQTKDSKFLQLAGSGTYSKVAVTGNTVTSKTGADVPYVNIHDSRAKVKDMTVDQSVKATGPLELSGTVKVAGGIKVAVLEKSKTTPTLTLSTGADLAGDVEFAAASNDQKMTIGNGTTYTGKVSYTNANKKTSSAEFDGVKGGDSSGITLYAVEASKTGSIGISGVVADASGTIGITGQAQLTAAFTLGKSNTLIVESGATLTAGKTLTITDGVLYNNGTLTVSSSDNLVQGSTPSLVANSGSTTTVGVSKTGTTVPFVDNGGTVQTKTSSGETTKQESDIKTTSITTLDQLITALENGQKDIVFSPTANATLTKDLDIGDAKVVIEGHGFVLGKYAIKVSGGSITGLIRSADESTKCVISAVGLTGTYTIAEGNSVDIDAEKISGKIIVFHRNVELSGNVTGDLTIEQQNGQMTDPAVKFSDLVVINGAKLTLTNGTKITYSVVADHYFYLYGSLYSSSEVTVDVPSKATFKAFAGAGISGVTVDGKGSIDLSQAQNPQTVGEDISYDKTYGQLEYVTVIGSLTIKNNAVVKVLGGFELNEGVTLTIQKGSKLIIDSVSADMIVNGVIKVEEGAILQVADAKEVKVSGSIESEGALTLTGTVTVKSGGSILVKDATVDSSKTGGDAYASTFSGSSSLTIEAGAQLIVESYIGKSTITNKGTVVLNGAVLGGELTVKMAASGATVEIDSVTGTSPVSISDEGMKFAKNVYVTSPNTVSFTPGSGVTLKGLTVSENVTSYVDSSNTTRYTNNFVLSGAVAASKENDTATNPLATIAVSGGKISVPESLALGERVKLDLSAGEMKVSGLIDATSKNSVITSAGEIEVSGSIVAITKITSGINAAMYESKVGTDTVYNYVTLVAALDAKAADIEVLGSISVLENAAIPAGTTVKGSGTITVGSAYTTDGADVILTVLDGGSLRNTSVTVAGTLVFENKKDNRTTVYSDVSVIGDVSSKYTNLYTALNQAQSGDTVTVTGDIVYVTKSITVKDGVVLEVPLTKQLVVSAGVTITVDGVLETAEEIVGYYDSTAKTTVGFDLKASVKENKASIQVAGAFMSMADLTYAKYTIPGAYYAITDSQGIYNCVSNLADAATTSASYVEIFGEVTAGDVSFAGTSTSTRTLAVDDDTGVLTVASITLSKAVLDVDGKFSGTVKVGDAAIEAKYVEMYVEIDSNGVLEVFTVDESEKKLSTETASFKVSAGIVKIDFAFMDVTVASGATLAADGTDIDGKLTVEGTVLVDNGKELEVSGIVTVMGTLTIADATDTKDAGSFDINGQYLYVGITKKNATGATATVSGPITDASVAFVIAGASVSESTLDSYKVNGVLKSTTYMVEGKEWMTVYDATGNYVIGNVKDPTITNAKFGDEWLDSDGADASAKKIGDSKCTKVTAKVDYEIYDLYVLADTGVENIAVDGNLMVYSVFGGYYCTENLKAGSHTISYTLKNGYSGTAKLALVETDDYTTASVSGMAVSISGSEGDVLVQLTGIEKSGYVDPVQPVEPKNDDGLKVTDYLLIVLVILVVILAVIVAMRLMRS